MSSFRVQGILSLDGSRFSAGLKQAEIGAKRFAGEVVGHVGRVMAGLFTVGALEEFTRKTIGVADALVIAAQRTGLTVEQLQVLKAAAKDSGVELESVEKAFEKINVAREKALSGSEEGQKLLKRFAQAGISKADLASMTAQQMFQGPLAAFARGRSVEDVGPILRDILGKGVAELLPVMQTDFGELEAKMRKLGMLMETDTAVKLKLLSEQFEALGNVMIAHFAPMILKAVEGIMKGVGGFLGWMDERMKPKETEPAAIAAGTQKGGLRRAWDFSGKVGSGIVGGVTGLFGLWDAIIGDTEKADERLMQAQGWFKMAGLEGGWMNEAADAMVKRANEGKPTLKAAWDQIMEDWKAEADKMANRIKNPPTGNYAPEPAEIKAKRVNIPSDKLIDVGNFFGAGASASIQRIAEEQLNVQREMRNYLARIAEAARYPFQQPDFGGND